MFAAIGGDGQLQERLSEMCSAWAESYEPVGQASRLDRHRGKMPLPHRKDDRIRNADPTIAIKNSARGIFGSLRASGDHPARRDQARFRAHLSPPVLTGSG